MLFKRMVILGQELRQNDLGLKLPGCGLSIATDLNEVSEAETCLTPCVVRGSILAYARSRADIGHSGLYSCPGM